MANKNKYRDPRGHSLRVYADVYDSPAWESLSPHDVLAYLALLRDLKGYNNGDLSLPLSRAKSRGIAHQSTLAKALRALCAVGLIAITRRGGSTKGGQRLPNLYRLTDRECYEITTKNLEAMAATNEWKRVTSIEHGRKLIAEAEVLAATKSQPKSEAIKAGLGRSKKTKSLGHAVTLTRSPNDLVGAVTRSPHDLWNNGLGHGVTLVKVAENPASMRVPAEFSPEHENTGHRSPDSPPLYIATPTADKGEPHQPPDVDGDPTTDQPLKAKTPKSPTSAPKAKPAPKVDPIEKTALGLSGEAGQGDSDVMRVRDDQPAALRCEQTGEYVRPKPSIAGTRIRETDAMVAAMLTRRLIHVTT